MAMLLAAGTLICAIIGQYLIFDRRLRDIVSSVTVERVLSRNPVRKGTPLQVATSITVQGSSRMRVQIDDLVPRNSNLVDGDPFIIANRDPETRTYECRYRIVPLVHGTQQFTGVSVNIRNQFFETTVLMTREQERMPLLSVLPTGFFTAPASDMADGTRDHRRASTWTGVDVHSLREYMIGDDLRHADWKMSAKYDKIFIRKYTAPMSHPPLVIVDLPWNGMPYPKKEFSRMVSEVTGMAKHAIQTYQYVSILIISGPNVLHLIREERNLSRCLAVLREWMSPQERPVHFYRMPDRSDIRAQVRSSEYGLDDTQDPKTRNFLEALRDRYNSVLPYQRNPAFSGQVGRVLAQVQMTEAYLFTLGCGDTSHIRHIVRPLKTQNVRVSVKMISPQESSEEIADTTGNTPEGQS